MSVKHRACLGYGYYIKLDEIGSLPTDKYNEFMGNDYTIRINSWSDNSGYFFGILLCSIEPGECFKIPAYNKISHDELMRMIHMFKEFFPNHKDYLCENYVINQID